jgi:hypothetical protein
MSSESPGRGGRRDAASPGRARITNTNAANVLASHRPSHPCDEARFAKPS